MLLRLTVKAKTVYQKLINRKESLKMLGTYFRYLFVLSCSPPLFSSESQQHDLPFWGTEKQEPNSNFKHSPLHAR